jgi:hypothetical protein
VIAYSIYSAMSVWSEDRQVTVVDRDGLDDETRGSLV